MSPFAWGCIVLGALLGFSRYQIVDLKRTQAVASQKAAEQLQEVTAEYRGKEQALVSATTRFANEAHQAKLQLAAQSRDLAGRLQQRAGMPDAPEATRAAAAACRVLDVPAAAILPDRTRGDLVGQAERAEVTRGQLGKCVQLVQEYREILRKARGAD